jgi:DNA-binding NtrC family response regulator
VSTAKDSFRESKARLIERFEKEYIEQALEHAQGNIAMAARASNKHRRAFWALMRKYDIDAEQYRVEDL